MQIDRVITQIRALSPIFAGNVAGAAAYANGVEDQAWLPLPACYVVPLDDDAGENTSQTGTQQIVTERIAVILVMDNSTTAGDRRGQASAEQYGLMRGAIFRAILNWRPDWNPENPAANRESRGIYYVRGSLVDFDLARLFYQFDFALDTTITELDGWLEVPVPLVDVRSIVTDINTGETLAVFDNSITQP